MNYSATMLAALLILVLPAARVAASICAAPAFGSPREVPLPGSAFEYGVASADFDGDGHLDIAAVYERPTRDQQDLHVLRGNGAGGFTATTTAMLANRFLLNLRAAEVTGDGDIDLVATAIDGDGQDAYVLVLEGDGGGGFTPGNPIGLDGFAIDYGLADVDGNGSLDIVVLTDGGGDQGLVASLLNDGSGGFGSPIYGPAGLNPSGVTTADFNGDGDVDVAIALFQLGEPTSPGRVEIRLGNGTGTFGPAVSSHVVPHPYRLKPGDFNEDGNIDVAVATAPPDQRGTITVLLGGGTGGMSAPAAFESVAGLFEVVVADFTGDGHLDLAGSGGYYAPARDLWVTALAVFPGSGTGTFGAPTVIHPQGDDSAFLPTAGDFDEDGRLDLAAAGAGPGDSAHIALFLSMCGNVADLSVSITDSADPVVTGQQVTYTVTVVNNGPDPASASLGFRVPGGMRFVSAAASTGGCVPSSELSPPRDGLVRCVLGDLAGSSPGNTRTVTVVMRAGAGGTKEALSSVVTSVMDPVTDNNTDTESTVVTVPGGTDVIITAPGGTTSLTWTDGDAEAGYVVWRYANGVVTRFPAAGMLPATASSFVDSSAVPGTVNCYRVVASAADETPIAASQWLCQVPNSASPPDALGDFRLRFEDAGRVRLEWSPFSGHTGYVIRMYRASGTAQTTVLSPTTVSLTTTLAEFTCYVVVPVNGSTALANSPALCAVPASSP
jgi:uncharacterized repeat protein (TIGR01451 family)